MGLLSRLGFAVAAVATIAVPARSEPYSPFLGDLRAKVQFLLDHAGARDEQDPEIVALRRALAALDRPSTSVVDDLGNLSRAVRTLEPTRPGRTWVHTGTWESVHTAIYLFYYRLESRGHELRHLYFDSLTDGVPDGSRDLAFRALAAARAPLELDPFRRGSQRSATRRLLRAARLLERAAVNLAAGSDYTFPEGSVTAFIGDRTRTWRIASAAVSERAGPPGLERKELYVYAVSENPHSLVQIRPLTYTQPGEAMGGLIDFVDFPNEALLFPTLITRLQPNSDLPSEKTLESLDLAAGTAHVQFSLNMTAPEFHVDTLVTGEITITGGLERR